MRKIRKKNGLLFFQRAKEEEGMLSKIDEIRQEITLIN
jgi:hypothetical protein